MLFDVAREFLGAVLEEDVHAVLRDRLHVESEYRPPTASDELEEERAEEDWELEPIEASLSRVAPAVMRSWSRAWRSPRTAPVSALSKRSPFWGLSRWRALLRAKRPVRARKPSACASPDCPLVYCDEVLMVRVLRVRYRTSAAPCVVAVPSCSARPTTGRSCRGEFPAIVRSSGAVRKNST